MFEKYFREWLDTTDEFVGEYFSNINIKYYWDLEEHRDIVHERMYTHELYDTEFMFDWSIRDRIDECLRWAPTD